jgi:hypothetical protein
MVRLVGVLVIIAFFVAIVIIPPLVSRVLGRRRLRRTRGTSGDASARIAEVEPTGPSYERKRIANYWDYPPASVEGDRVDEASWQSFPASDAPPWR